MEKEKLKPAPISWRICSLCRKCTGSPCDLRSPQNGTDEELDKMKGTDKCPNPVRAMICRDALICKMECVRGDINKPHAEGPHCSCTMETLSQEGDFFCPGCIPYTPCIQSDAIVPEKRTDLEKFNDSISPEERGLIASLTTGDFITCGAMGQFGEKAAKIVEAAISERYFARLHRDQNIAEVKRLSVMIRDLREEARKTGLLCAGLVSLNCYEADCPNAGTERFSGKYLCPGHAEMYAKIRHDHERERRNDEARADDYDQREKENTDNGGSDEEKG